MNKTRLPHPAIDALRVAVEARPVVIVGSAPLTPPFVTHPVEVVVAVNGGIASVPGNPGVWVVNSRSSAWASWGPNRRRLAQLMIHQGAKRHVPLVVFLAREREAPAVTLEMFRKQATTLDRHVVVDHQGDRHILEYDAGARFHPEAHDAMSAGITAAAFALLAGASSVRLVGFSWQPGYAYLPGERIDARGHVLSDQRALVLLEQRYGPHALEHSLPIPDQVRRRYAGGKDSDMAKTPPTRPATRPAPAKATVPTKAPLESPQGIRASAQVRSQRVQATRDLQFQGRRIKAGDVFSIAPADFRPRQMALVTDEQPDQPAEAFKPAFPFPAAAQVRRGIPGMPRRADGSLPTIQEIAGQVRVPEEGEREANDQADQADPAGSPLE